MERPIFSSLLLLNDQQSPMYWEKASSVPTLFFTIPYHTYAAVATMNPIADRLPTAIYTPTPSNGGCVGITFQCIGSVVTHIFISMMEAVAYRPDKIPDQFLQMIGTLINDGKRNIRVVDPSQDTRLSLLKVGAIAAGQEKLTSFQEEFEEECRRILYDQGNSGPAYEDALNRWRTWCFITDLSTLPIELPVHASPFGEGIMD